MYICMMNPNGLINIIYWVYLVNMNMCMMNLSGLKHQYIFIDAPISDIFVSNLLDIY